MCRRISACPARARVHCAWYRARLEAAMLMRGCSGQCLLLGVGLFGVLCGCVLLARARVHRAWYCVRPEAAMLMQGCGAWAVACWAVASARVGGVHPLGPDV
eukprot:271950-Prymnesium_polylepis.1